MAPFDGRKIKPHHRRGFALYFPAAELTLISLCETIYQPTTHQKRSMPGRAFPPSIKLQILERGTRTGALLACAALSLAMLGGNAKADTRSDVQAAFNRCNIFADDRTWLNCVYGAAQPMRDKLGLPPAPASQTNLVPSASLMPQAVSSPPAPPSPQAARQGDKGGGFLSFLVGGQRLFTNVPMTAYRFDHDGLFTVTLVNGELWREIEGSPMAHWQGPASRYLVSVTTGSLDSYNFVVEGIQYKAKRLR